MSCSTTVERCLKIETLLGEKRTLGGKGSQAYESDGCYAPDLGSVDHLGSISQCSHGKGSSYSNYEVGSGGSGKGGKGNYEYYCPPEWDPLNNQFTCQMKPECDVVVN